MVKPGVSRAETGERGRTVRLLAHVAPTFLWEPSRRDPWPQRPRSSLIGPATSALPSVAERPGRAVTTLPAASDIGVASAFGSWSEARGQPLQLLLNIVVLIVVGVLTLRFVRLLWRLSSNRRNRDE